MTPSSGLTVPTRSFPKSRSGFRFHTTILIHVCRILRLSFSIPLSFFIWGWMPDCCFSFFSCICCLITGFRKSLL
ncbi:hypothetical protein BDZ91DRAFT_736967 [Kalaharituber pfeilii]|nr:hypothetical protein BDZ91DRAFT_736967 [Kalaharituber pfeilii]